MIWRLGLLSISVAVPVWATSPQPANELTFGRFGKVAILRPSTAVDAVVLFVSGDGGWNKGVVDMAHQLQAKNTLVVGIDTRQYLKVAMNATHDCLYAAADFEALSQYVQRWAGLTDYRPPILVGYSSGATLAYGVAAQAPSGTFAAVLVLGFCPDLETLKPLCRGTGLTHTPLKNGKGYWYDARPDLDIPLHVLQGEIDQVCAPEATKRYVATIQQAKLHLLPDVGHGYSVPRRWLPQFLGAYDQVVTSQARSPAVADATGRQTSNAPVEDLPLVEVAGNLVTKAELVVLLSGDGGWAGLDKQMASDLAAQGYQVIGWNSLRYYWTKRTPDLAAADLQRILSHYATPDSGRPIILIGYSLGADVLPFLAGRLPQSWRKRLVRVVMIAPSREVAFEFHLSNWTGGRQADALPTAPEVEKLRGLDIVCVYGDRDDDTLCPSLPADLATVVKQSGGHHFGGDYQTLVQIALAGLKQR